MRTVCCIFGFVSYLWGGDVENFSDFGVQLPDVGESMDPACGTPVSQLSVEDEPRSRVIRRPSWWWRWRRQRRRRGLATALTVPLVLGLLLIHNLSRQCLGVKWTHSPPVLHQARAQVSSWESRRCTAAATRGALSLVSQAGTQSFEVKTINELVMRATQ